MAIGDSYIDLATFRLWAGKLDAASTDERITAALAAASRQIEGTLARQFNRSATDDVRYYTVSPLDSARSPWLYGGSYPSLLRIGDWVSITSIDTDNGSRMYPTAWETDDYLLGPGDAADLNQPYTYLEAVGSLGFPCGRESVRITGIVGWPAVPEPIKQATYMIANRQLSLQRAPFGQTGAGEMGGGLNMTAALTPMIREILAPYNVLTV